MLHFVVFSAILKGPCRTSTSILDLSTQQMQPWVCSKTGDPLTCCFLWERLSWTIKFWGTLESGHAHVSEKANHPLDLWKFWLHPPQGLLDGLTDWRVLPFTQSASNELTPRECQIHNSQRANDRTASDHMCIVQSRSRRSAHTSTQVFRKPSNSLAL